MSTGWKSSGSSNSGARASRTNVDAARKWVAEETRAEAKELLAQHSRETSGLDVLSRCKKLNELLSSDVLSGKGDAKAQLKEILGILHAGPKRPAFLDKPPVTAIAGKRSTPPTCAPETPLTPPAASTVPNDDVNDAQCAPHDRSKMPQPTAGTTLQRPSEEVDDIITLLNGTSPRYSSPIVVPADVTEPASTSEQRKRGEQGAQQRKPDEAAKATEAERLRIETELAQAAEHDRKARDAAEAAEQQRKAEEAVERERKAREAAAVAEQQRKAKEAAEAAERERKAREAAEAAERERKAREAAEEAERQRAAEEALRLQRLQYGAALCIQSHWRGHCGRRQAALRRQELEEQHTAASILQAAWRSRQAALEHRQRLVAAGTLQCAVRAWRARRHLHQIRVEAFVRRRAARVIQSAFIAYHARGYTLGPLRLPPGPRPRSSAGVDGAALLAKRLRLRSAVDTRLAPECAANSCGGADDDGARQHRTVVTHMERVRQVSANERNRRCDVSERAIMVASEHRDTAEALAIARQGFGLSTPRALSPSTTWPPTQDCVRPDTGSRRGSSSRPGSDAGGQLIAGALSCDAGALALGPRPSTGVRRTQGSIGG